MTYFCSRDYSSLMFGNQSVSQSVNQSIEEIQDQKTLFMLTATSLGVVHHH
jgi:hypothetical protein